jgi:murein DD-endopeptidase MepM/ murein hydrolase activator NlpD
MQENDLNPVLALELADIYAWSIDFYQIQKGDQFKVYFSEKYVEDEYVGIDSIYAAIFTHRNVEFSAILFEQDGLTSYFDELGNSLQKAFLQTPVKFSRISSRYTKKRFHPVLKRNKAHLGTDYAAPTGTPIYTTGDGVITHASYTSGNGNYVKIRHNTVYTTQYLHMSKFAAGTKAGKAVKQGTVIGYVGSTGLATGPHVCYRFWKNGNQVDPYKEKIPPSFPVKEENKPVFEKKKNEVLQHLRSADNIK